ncbi:hypothetical protein RM844_11955 [Streptomyces sp. DSM 44915]|uniref:Uncharacterized protein n=1 Tax=Streptomyces chisholmiae TaxID=3075540 RepID=A0ABU2JPU3_9ACTN|nr:hypothetical protein [Streptomyces sp. DSM 44915]MDT0267003.1 hypothetical protein [Streptomyces sp. DSM 44915]
MITYLRSDEIDLSYDDDEPLGLVAEMSKALRRHGLVLPSLGLESTYVDNPDPDSCLVQLGGARGDIVRRIVEALNAAPVRQTTG